MSLGKRFVAAAAVLALALALYAGGTVVLVWATLDGPEREAVGAVLGSRVALVFMAWLVAFAFNF